jgi:DNA-binding protein Fis
MDGNWHPHQKEHLEQIALEEIVEKKLSQFMHRLGKFDVENLHGVIIERVERPLIKLAMKKAGNNQLRAAKILGINRNTLRSKLQKLDLI